METHATKNQTTDMVSIDCVKMSEGNGCAVDCCTELN